MALPVASFNFQGFIEADKLFSYKNLFASQSSALKDKDLCQFLSQMDQTEYDLIVLENREITVLEESSEKWFKRTVVVDLLAFTYVGFTFLFGEKLRLGEINNLYKKVFHIGGLIPCAMALGAIYAPMYAADNRESKMSALSKKRTERLQEKFERIQTAYQKLKDANVDSNERTQMRDAKRFFKDQLEKTVKRT
jgi:gas vesicle protein